MRILVLSDSHGDIDSMKTAVRRVCPDQILHLGDYVRDTIPLAQAYPDIPITRVRGNCDAFDRRNSAPEELSLTVEGHRIFLCHGHTYQVYFGTAALARRALEEHAALCLFGHTHSPLRLVHDSGLLVVNPGSIGASLRREYAVAELDENRLAVHLCTL